MNLCMDGEPGGRASLAEELLAGAIVTGRINLRVSITLECIQ